MYFDFAMERVKIRVLIPNVPAGIVTMCREQHSAREQRVELACLTSYVGQQED